MTPAAPLSTTDMPAPTMKGPGGVMDFVKQQGEKILPGVVDKAKDLGNQLIDKIPIS